MCVHELHHPRLVMRKLNMLLYSSARWLWRDKYKIWRRDWKKETRSYWMLQSTNEYRSVNKYGDVVVLNLLLTVDCVQYRQVPIAAVWITLSYQGNFHIFIAIVIDFCSSVMHFYIFQDSGWHHKNMPHYRRIRSYFSLLLKPSLCLMVWVIVCPERCNSRDAEHRTFIDPSVDLAAYYDDTVKQGIK